MWKLAKVGLLSGNVVSATEFLSCLCLQDELKRRRQLFVSEFKDASSHEQVEMDANVKCVDARELDPEICREGSIPSVECYASRKGA